MNGACTSPTGCEDLPVGGRDTACSAEGTGRERPAPVPSERLLRGQRMVEILHNGEVYRLQATRLGKLILTK